RTRPKRITSSAIWRSLNRSKSFTAASDSRPAGSSLGQHLLELEQPQVDRLAGTDHVGERGGADLAADEADQAAVLAAVQAVGGRRGQPRRQQAIERPRLAAALDVTERGDTKVEAQPPLLALEVLRQLDGVVP